ncbi:hypothetical protein [Streptomyces flavofungini]|uniref:hypothetical protein n=1 Tax=Streptomyces flavofungini TaxID=68200 RepID=UPI0034DF9FDE
MRVRTTLAAGVLAVAALMGSAGSALANDDGYRNEGGFRACGQFAGTGHHTTFWGEGCSSGHWAGDGHRGNFNGNMDHGYRF